ncbi:MAG: nuclear transport factor 2 family protein [Acidobacteriota bacterium]
MRRTLASAMVVLTLVLGVYAQTASDEAELTKLLKEFLAGASRNDAAVHDRFWAEDLIYTGSSGRRVGKADIMRDVRSAAAPKPGDPTTIYSAEDIRIHQYEDMAIVAFRLLGTTDKDGKPLVMQYLNTGTFLKRNGKWQVVSWQATRMPRTEEEIKKEISITETAFHQAILTSDIKKLTSLMDESFIWIDQTGEQITRQKLFDHLGSGQLKYSKLETNNVTIYMHGDAAVVRGVSPQQRSSIPNSKGSGDASPFTTSYTLTFVNKGGEWKIVTMHSSTVTKLP